MTSRPDPSVARLLEHLSWELVPMKSASSAIDELPAASTVSVTCSPVKGIGATIELSDEIRRRGHTVVPHLAARMVTGDDHVATIARWLRTEGIETVFVVAGDAETPAGSFTDSISFLRALLAADAGVRRVGVTAYPDGHPLIDNGALSDALHQKQALLAEAGLDGYAATQMCFDPDRIGQWLAAERQAGFELPVHLGIPGALDRAKLVTMGARLGVGTSLRFLRKNSSTVRSLLSRNFDPLSVLTPLGPDMSRLAITDLHCFTFNQVAATEAWRVQALDPARA